MVSLPLVKYVLMAALRDRLVLSMMLLIVVGAAVSLFLGSAAMIEDDQFSLVYAAGGLRFAGVAGLVLFAVFFLRRSFDNKDVDFLLSRPISRTAFILSHALAFSLIAAAMAVAVVIALVLVSPGGVGAGHLRWGVSILLEFIIVVNAALFFSMVLTSAAGGVLSVFGLYVLARLMGQLLSIAATGGNLLGLPMHGVMNIIAMVTPRLDLMAQTSWLVYPDDPVMFGYGFMIAQGVFYTALLIVAALIDLRRRQF
jgi:ABC-type transport system involved in multi-copper enzyme maturation permease subunit